MFALINRSPAANDCFWHSKMSRRINKEKTIHRSPFDIRRCNIMRSSLSWHRWLGIYFIAVAWNLFDFNNDIIVWISYADTWYNKNVKIVLPTVLAHSLVGTWKGRMPTFRNKKHIPVLYQDTFKLIVQIDDST